MQTKLTSLLQIFCAREEEQYSVRLARGLLPQSTTDSSAALEYIMLEVNTHTHQAQHSRSQQPYS